MLSLIVIRQHMGKWSPFEMRLATQEPAIFATVSYIPRQGPARCARQQPIGPTSRLCASDHLSPTLENHDCGNVDNEKGVLGGSSVTSGAASKADLAAWKKEHRAEGEGNFADRLYSRSHPMHSWPEPNNSGCNSSARISSDSARRGPGRLKY